MRMVEREDKESMGTRKGKGESEEMGEGGCRVQEKKIRKSRDKEERKHWKRQ